MTPPEMRRGEVWDINFDPQVGAEINKVRPGVVMDVGAVRLQLRIVVPITAWHPEFGDDASKVRLEPSAESGLSKVSAADAYQIKSLSLQRLVRRRGVLPDEAVDSIAAAVALLVDAPP